MQHQIQLAYLVSPQQVIDGLQIRKINTALDKLGDAIATTVVNFEPQEANKV